MGLFVSYLESVTGKKSANAFEDKKLLKPYQTEALKNIAGSEDGIIKSSTDIGKAKAKEKKQALLAKTLAKVKK